MPIKAAAFIKSSGKWEECPPVDKPEFAFIGRSNVGKSSLINMLVGVKGLAKTSQTPGKTQSINHFLINDSWYLVDLPGYGYARTSKDNRKIWGAMTENYLKQRDNLICLCILIDSRLEPQKADVEFINKVGEWELPQIWIFTKGDKLGKNALNLNVQKFCTHMLDYWEELPPYFISSAETKMGKEEIIKFLDTSLAAYKEESGE